MRTVLFFPLNSPGHINSSLGIADILKREHDCRTIFLLLGKMMGTSIQDRGHELVTLAECQPFEDYEIEDDEDTSLPVDEEAKIKAGKSKKTFEGAYKWPQVVRRNMHLLRLPPAEAFVSSVDVMEKYMVGELIENHDNYAKAIEKIKPDLLVVDAYYIPPCVVNSKIPWVRLYSANPLPLTQSKLPNNAKPVATLGFKLFDKPTRQRIRLEEPNRWSAMIQEWIDLEKTIMAAMGNVGQKLSSFHKAHNCPPLELGKIAHDSPHLNIYMFPEVLDYDQDDDLFEYPKLWARCDSLMRQAANASSNEGKELDLWKNKLSKAISCKEAVVFFSLGSLASGNPELMKRFVEMFKTDERKLYVISKGANGDKYELNDSNMIGGNYIPQTYLLQKADVAVIHGGNNSVTECMYYGKPMIVLPVFSDQIDNAQRVEDLGFGRRLNVHECTGGQLIKAIDELVADKELRNKVRLIGERMRSKDDLKEITGALVKLADKGHLTEEDIDKCCRKHSSK